MIKLKLSQKKGFSTQSWVIGLILLSTIIALFNLMVAEQAILYSNPGIVNEELLSAYNKLENSTSIVQDAFEASTANDGLSLIGAFDVLFASSFTIISLIFNSIPILASITTSFATDFGVPTEVAVIIFPAFLAIVTITIIYRVINSTTRAPI